MVVRRCPTLPHPPGCSTIGAVGLSFRVRNGTGRFPHAMTAVTLAPHQPNPGSGGGKNCGYNIVVLLFSYRFSSNGFVGWEPHSGRKQSCFFVPVLWCERLLNAVHALVCGVSYRPISTGQLHVLPRLPLPAYQPGDLAGGLTP